MANNLKKDGISLTTIDTKELELIVNNNDPSIAIIVPTGTLPESVYSGNGTDPIFSWLSAGGYLYWIGGNIGREYFTFNDEKCVVDNSDELFFGVSDCTHEDQGRNFARNLEKEGVTDILGFYYSEYTCGVKVSKLISPYFCTDYSCEGYYALVFVKYYAGFGTLCIFGGELKGNYINADFTYQIAHVISSRVTYNSHIVDYVKSTCVNGCTVGKINCIPTKTDVFIFLGLNDNIYERNISV